jgi:hypothetical protein
MWRALVVFNFLQGVIQKPCHPKLRMTVLFWIPCQFDLRFTSRIFGPSDRVGCSGLNLILNLFCLTFCLDAKSNKKIKAVPKAVAKGCCRQFWFFVLRRQAPAVAPHRLCLTFCLDAKSNKKIKAVPQAVATGCCRQFWFFVLRRQVQAVAPQHFPASGFVSGALFTVLLSSFIFSLFCCFAPSTPFRRTRCYCLRYCRGSD